MDFFSAERENRNFRTRIFTGLTVAVVLVAAAVGLFVLMNDSDSSDAATFTVDGVKYSPNGSEATVIGYEGMPISITIPSSVTSGTTSYSVTAIDAFAFGRCTSLMSLTISNSVITIKSEAFYGCTSLTSITIPASVTAIGDYAFGGCSSLTSINVDESNTTYSSVNGVLFDKSKTELIQYPSGKKDPSYEIPNYVTSIGSSAFHRHTSLTSVVIPSSVTTIGYSAFEGCTSLTSITIPDSVTTIGYSAFEGCTSLTSITIPTSVTTIGDHAFDECTSLTSVVIPSSVTEIRSGAFEGCTSLTSVTIPGSVTTIGDNAFDGCTSLTSITIPDSVTTIGNYAFYGCASLTSVTIPASVTTIGGSVFYGCTSLTAINVDESNTACSSVNGVLFDKSKTNLIQYPAGKQGPYDSIPNSVEEIGYHAFDGCASLTSVVIPNSVITIWDHAFEGCASLTSVTIPASVTTIGGSVFYGCTSLTAIEVTEGNAAFTSEKGVLFNKSQSELIQYPVGKQDPYYDIPNSVQDIGFHAFYGCTSLTSVTIPNSVTEIRYGAFYGCTSLTSVIIPNLVTYIGGCAFEGCTSLTSVIIPNTVTEIGSGAFDGCTSLTSVIIPDSVEWIGSHTFHGCTSLTSVTIPNKVTEIEFGAFDGCASLTSVVIPSSVTEIGSGAFYDCTSLTSITIPASVTTIGDYAFYGCTSLTAINVDESNTEYSSDNGVLFNKSKTNLIQYPSGNKDPSYKIPDSVSSVNKTAFTFAENLKSISVDENNPYYSSQSGCLYDKTGKILVVCPSGLSTVTLGENTVLVDSGAFFGKNLKEVTIANGTSVLLGMGAFYDCTGLEKISIASSASVTFSEDAIEFLDEDKHTIHVVAPEGFRIPDWAFSGNVEFIYDEPPTPDSDDKKFPVIPVVIGSVVGVLALAGAAFFIIRRRA